MISSKDTRSRFGVYATLVNCWANLRRKFIEAKGTADKNSKAAQVVIFCDELFRSEREIQKLSPEEKFQVRDKKAKPLLDQSWKWISSFHSLSGSNLGKPWDTL
ncbi:IS66 family transposase [Enterococcus sp. JM9B]|uniref:IS66 family transposase n=1 Tax=Enterococcus sp. JM9B TaxID=1857216 RepID=UPI0013751997